MSRGWAIVAVVAACTVVAVTAVGPGAYLALAVGGGLGVLAGVLLLLSRLRRLARQAAESQRVEEDLQRGEERFRRLSEAAFEGLLIHDDGLILDANPALAQMFGYELEQMVGKYTWDFLTPESRAAAEPRINADYESPYELTGIHKNGTLIPIEVCAKTLLWKGRRLRAVAVRDITERKRLEERLREAQKMEAVGRLAGGVAHDFNNLLTVIGGYSQMLLQSLSAEDPRRVAAEEIFQASERAAELARQLLAFGRRQIMQLRVVNLNQLISNMQKLLQQAVTESVQLRLSLNPELGNVKADPGQLEQVIMNLALNARDAMPQGGRLSVTTKNLECDQHELADGGVLTGRYVVLAVSDSGWGMDEATRKRVFEPFFTTKPRGKGAGLGLAMVYGIVKQHGGAVEVESAPGQGTTFRVYLPLVEEPVSPAGETPAEDATGGNETILVVEDEAGVRHLARRSLERLGYTVLEASEPAVAQRLCATHPGHIHLLVTDVIMPGMSGRQLADELVRARPGMKVLFLSGYSENVIAHAGALDPGLNFLAKPFTPSSLARKVREVLDA